MVDLSRGEFVDREIPEEYYRKFLAGYGLAAKVLFDEMKPGADPLGPENILAVMSGILTGKSPNPVYLLIDGDRIELADAKGLWGADTEDTEKKLKEKHGNNFKIACIGKGGENLALIAGVVTDGGRLAARGGLGAVMGSKNLKAICLNGDESGKEKCSMEYYQLWRHHSKRRCTLLNMDYPPLKRGKNE